MTDSRASEPLEAPGLIRLSRTTTKQQTDTLSNVEPFETTSNDDITTSPPPFEMIEKTNDRRRQRPRRYNMDKLRNRWWDLLRQHQERLLEERNSSSSDDDDVDTEDDHSSQGSFVESFSSFGPVQVPAIHEPTTTSSTREQSTLLEPYRGTEFPIHDAIRRGDEAGLRAVLKAHKDSSDWEVMVKGQSQSSAGQSYLSPALLAVDLDQPKSLRVLVTMASWNPKQDSELLFGGPEAMSPLLHATALGREECVQVLLQHTSPSALFQKDSNGNSVLHVCCRNPNGASLLQLLFDATHNNNTLRSKLFQSQNFKQQTPLHVACQCGGLELVEQMLSVLSLSLLSKLLVQVDVDGQTPLLAAVASGSTEVVMSLLMWRGNNHVSTTNAPSKPLPCPLTWAVRLRDPNMVLLLLEFNDPSGKGYNLHKALYTAVDGIRMMETEKEVDDVDLELVRVLVEAGANPFLVDRSGKADSNSVLVSAVQWNVSSVLSALMDSYESYLGRVRNERRQDPYLQKQPESFFRGLESQENAERSTALRDALVVSLINGYRVSPQYFASSVVLYEKGASMGLLGLERLQRSLVQGSLVPSSDSISVSARECTYETRHRLSVHPKNIESSDTPWVLSLLEQDDTVTCPWLSSHLDDKDARAFDDGKLDVVLVCDDGSQLFAHSEIVAKASEKLAAAIRFSDMSSNNDKTITTIELQAPRKVGRWMLQHMYHGSIVSGLSNNNIESLTNDLMDLLLFADECFCSSLVQECEMRLLSANPCHCLCQSCVTLVRGDNDDEQCFYRTMGPSICITSSSVLDLYALAQQVGDSQIHTNAYKIAMSWSETSMASLLQSASIVQPLECLKEAAIRYMLLNFESLLDQLSIEEADNENAPLWVLQACLQDMCLSPMTHIVRPRQWSTKPTNKTFPTDS